MSKEVRDGVTPESGDGVTPESGDGVTPESGDGVTPESGDGVTPESGDGVTPESGDGVTPESGDKKIKNDKINYSNFDDVSLDDFLTNRNDNLKSAAYIWQLQKKEERESKGLHFAIDASSALIVFVAIFLLVAFFYEVEHEKNVDLNKYLSQISNLLPILIGYIIGKKL